MLFIQRAYNKKDVYNLNEDEELTHFGQSLAEMEKFTDFVNSDDESEERGLLSGKIKVTVFDQKRCLIIVRVLIMFSHPAELTASHFGGGGGLLRKKTSEDQQEEDGSQRAKSRQELIEELILKSKQEKVSTNCYTANLLGVALYFICTPSCLHSHVQRERQAQKEEAQELTEKLDKEWKSIQALMVKKSPKAESDDKPEEKPKVGLIIEIIKCAL